MNTIINHKALILARESRGLTQKQLVDSIPNLNQGNYSKMEKGLLNIPADTLHSVAQKLDYPEAFFYQETVKTPISSFYYRKRISMAKKDLSILEAKLDIFRGLVDELLDSVDVPEYKIPSYKVDDEFSPSDIAIKTREFLKIPRGPIKNLVLLLEAAGIIIYFFKTDAKKFDGITLLTDKGQPIIFINDSLPNDRKILTIAHELFHLISHIPFSPLPEGRDEEKEAFEFAGEFLMPYLDCRNDLMDLRYSQLGIFKSYWYVSKAAIIRRAKEIYSITNERYTNLNIELSRNGERKKENGFVDIDSPKLLELLIKTHKEELGYTLDDLLGILKLNESDYYKYFEDSSPGIYVTKKKVIDMSEYLRVVK